MSGLELIRWIMVNHAENATIKVYRVQDDILLESPEPTLFPAIEERKPDGSITISKDKQIICL